MNSSVPILGQALIPVSKSDVAGIPAVALNIPDFEGSAILRIYSNSSQTQIACFSAVMRNGASLSHPKIIGPVLILFVLVAILASFLTTIHGASIPQIRNHYAHSFSVLLIFEAFQSIFFSGALSLDWPSILTAWWSNFAWSCGMIYSSGVTKSLNSFVGIYGNSSQVGGAGSTVLNNNGGLQQRIYGRSMIVENFEDTLVPESQNITRSLIKRAMADKNDTRLYAWAGLPVSPGLPLPGNWSGFAGELSLLGIPAADAFLNSLVWLLILILVLVISLASFKFALEGISMAKLITPDSFTLFRTQWLTFLTQILLRAGFISFFMIMTLTLYQFSYGGEAGPIAVAAIVFLFTFFGYLAISFYACYYEAQAYHEKVNSTDHQNSDSYPREKSLMMILKRISPMRRAKSEEINTISNNSSDPGSLSKDTPSDDDNHDIHQNIEYLKRFGWLSARYRRTRWWFFAIWIVYQFVRACLVGGARAHPEAQIIGLFIWESASFICFIIFDPWEGRRNTVFAVWMLGITKVITSGLSIAFLPRLKVARIPTTVIGIFIIITQGLLVITLLILILLGAISSYLSLARDRKNFKPENLQDIRLKYYAHIEEKAKDRTPSCPPEPEVPKEPYFNVNYVRREPKIEDETPISSVYTPAASILSLVRNDQLHFENNHNNFINNRLSTRLDSSSASMKSQISRCGTVPLRARALSSSLGSYEINDSCQNESSSQIVNGQISTGFGISSVPLIRPSTPAGSLRAVMPSTQQQMQFANQRVNSST